MIERNTNSVKVVSVKWKLLKITLPLGLLLLVGCMMDEIRVDVSVKEGVPSFHFSSIREPNRAVRLSGVIVEEVGTGNVIWHVGSLDPKLLRGRYEDIPREQRAGIAIADLVFAQIPLGFEQLVPRAGTSPIIREGIRYRIDVVGDAAGRTEFTSLKECRKVSLTPFTKDMDAYVAADQCD